MKALLTLLTIIMLVGSTAAQEKAYVKRIYLVDVTKSMIGEGKINGKYGTDAIFEDLKDDLASTIENGDVCGDDEIVIIPFTNRTFDAIRGDGYKRQSIANEVRALSTQSGDTNIDAAWLAGINELDSNRINLLFLMTDGIHNCGPNVSQLYKHLEEWENLADNGKNFAFYFMLNKNAESAKIDSIAEKILSMQVIHSSNIKINILLLHTDYEINVRGKQRAFVLYPRGSSCNRKDLIYGVSMSLDDQTNYKIGWYNIYTNKIELEFVGKKSADKLPLSEQNTLSFEWQNRKNSVQKTFVFPQKIDIKINNLDTRTMKIY